MSRRLRSGFSIVEVTVSIVLTGIMLTVALQTVSQSNLTQHRTLERARAGELARMLANEILQHSYVEPVAAATFGAESGETRATYDDVDDYNGLSESPPVWVVSVPGNWRGSIRNGSPRQFPSAAAATGYGPET
jgi:MSHA pilin protein MshD